MSIDYNLIYTSKDVGKAITKLRTQKKLSGYKLALKCSMNPSVLMRIEKGEREPYLNTILRIIEALEMTPAEFFLVVQNK